MMKTTITAFLFTFLGFYQCAKAQAVYGSECKKNYPEIKFSVSMRCNVVEEKKDDGIVSLRNSIKDKNKQRDYEVTIINLNKLKNPSTLNNNQLENEGKKGLERLLKDLTAYRDIKWLYGSLYGKKVYYNTMEEKAEYRQYVLLKREGYDFMLEYNLHLFFEDGLIGAFAEYYTMKDISSGFANDLRAGKESYWETFYSSPNNIEYTRDTLQRKNAVPFDFSITHPRHYLRVTYDSTQKKFLFSPLGIWDELVIKDKKFADISLKHIKKLSPNETFSAYAAPFLKQSSNNKLNDTEIKNLNKNIANVLVFREMLIEDSRSISHPYYPAKIVFEWNKNIYEISGDVSQHKILEDIYASVRPVVKEQTTNTTETNNNSASQANQLIKVMEAWYNSFFGTNKQGRIEQNALLGVGTSRYATDLKLANYTTFIQEEGVMPVEKRYWVALVGSFDTKDEAVAELRKWIPFFDEFKTEYFSLTKTSASPTSMLWHPKILDKEKIPEQFSKMEVKVERAELLYSDKGTAKMKHEVYIKIGSPLNF